MNRRKFLNKLGLGAAAATVAPALPAPTVAQLPPPVPTLGLMELAKSMGCPMVKISMQGCYGEPKRGDDLFDDDYAELKITQRPMTSDEVVRWMRDNDELQSSPADEQT